MDRLGRGLNFVIACDYVPHHDWMAFATWVSVRDHLPEANFFVTAPRRESPYLLFAWCRRCRVPVRPSVKLPQPAVRLSPELVMVRDPDAGQLQKIYECGEILSVGADSEGVDAAFVNYATGWPGFVLGDWVNSVAPPFGPTATAGTANQVRLAALWKRLGSLYPAVGR